MKRFFRRGGEAVSHRMALIEATITIRCSECNCSDGSNNNNVCENSRKVRKPTKKTAIGSLSCLLLLHTSIYEIAVKAQCGYDAAAQHVMQ